MTAAPYPSSLRRLGYHKNGQLGEAADGQSYSTQAVPWPEVPEADGQRLLDTDLLRRKVIKSNCHWTVNFMIVIL